MAGTVELPGIGQVKKAYVYVGAAAVAGVLVVAYYRSANSAAAPADSATLPAEDSSAVGMPADTGSGGAPGYGSSAGSTSTTVGDVIADNTQWYAAAYEAATNAGYDSLMAGVALGKFLARQPLTSKEADLVRVGLAAAGQPPQGQPWVIVPESGPAKTPAPGHVSKPAAPANLHIISQSGSTVRIGWSSVAWVSGYVIFIDGSEHGPMHFGTWYTLRNMPTGQHTIGVRTMNRYKVLSDEARVSVNIAAPVKPKVPSKPTPTKRAA